MKKRTPPVLPDPIISRALSDVYSILNEIIDSDASLKVVKSTGLNSYKFMAKGPNGWVAAPAYLSNADKGRPFNQAQFDLTKYDTVTYKDTVLSILNEKSGETTGIKLGSLAKNTLLTTNKTGDFTIDSANSIFLDANTGRFFFYNAGDTDDYVRLDIGANGAGTFRTYDSDGQEANFTLAIDGEINFNPANNESVSIDSNCTLTNTGSTHALSIDYDHTGISAAGQSVSNIGIKLALNSDNPTHIGQVLNYGLYNVLVAGTSGIQNNYGIYNDVSGADSNYGIMSKVTDGHTDILMMSSADTSDYCRIFTTTNGATTIETLDASSNAAHLTLDADGDMILDSDTGNFIAKKAGTEFSATNSAYAGMILGYTHLTNAGSTESYTLTTSYVVVDADAKVTFVAPPSGNVEIEFSVYRDSVSSNKVLTFALSDNATFNQASAEIGDGSSTVELIYSLGFDSADETDDRYVTGKFVACGLTAGNSYTYWIGAKTNATTMYLRWGVRTDTDPDRAYPPFLIKATALPASIHTQ
jgi:hypothetical protein